MKKNKDTAFTIAAGKSQYKKLEILPKITHMYDWVYYGLPMFTVYMFPFTPQTMTNLGIPLNIPNH